MSDKFAQYLLVEIDKREWTQAELARRAGVSRAAISDLISGNRNAGAGICQDIAKAFGLPIETVYRQAGLLPDITARDTVMEILGYRLAELNPRQLDEILRYIDFIQDRDENRK